MHPIKLLVPYRLSSPDYRTVTTSIGFNKKKIKQIVRFCFFLFLLYSFLSDVYIYTCASHSLLLYSYSEDQNFCLSVTDNQKSKTKQIMMIIISFFFRFRLLNLCNACLLRFVFYLYICVILHLFIIDQNKITNRVYVCVVLLFSLSLFCFFKLCIEQRIIRAFKKRY